eukprot:gnl/TRDRNA2_/TRDRNA2_172641_c0_seq2.p1 gnl/TRDRNA2_/TRDRNA2_172641_c0~~gnl/TRDRNA2_/TRDRNA2_172641_c0_seq2.p1  ORF type:complete len:743 (+),score=130.95 gnl/TRDRNA2_/TRDRNA2_172641_c0_seq2:129-2357(+)
MAPCGCSASCRCLRRGVCGVLASVSLIVAFVSHHLVRHGSLFVNDPQGYPWPGDFPKLRTLDILQRPRCFERLLTPPGLRPMSDAGCPESKASGAKGWLDLRTAFLLQDAVGHWRDRWQRALSLLADVAPDANITVFSRPIEQNKLDSSAFEATLGSFVKALKMLPSNRKPKRPLYWAEASLIKWEKQHGSKKKPSTYCPFLGAASKKAIDSCQIISEFLFQEFAWVESMFGPGVHEVETSIWAGPAGSRTGLHADIEPFNLLAVLQGRKKITLWPSVMRQHLSPSERYDESASISAIDAFDPMVHQKFPAFAAVRHHNFTVHMQAGDVLHIPAGWWHIAENEETAVAATFHIWHWSWSEYMKWLPHGMLDVLHNMGLYRTGSCTCHVPTQPLRTDIVEFMNQPTHGETDDANCAADGSDASSTETKIVRRKVREPGRDDHWVMLHAEKSAYQALSVWTDDAMGSRYLLLDGDVQLTSLGEYVYHEMLAWVPLAATLCSRTVSPGEEAAALRVFVFGSGDGGMVQRLLRHSDVSFVLQVEIDEMVVNVARRFFPEIQPSQEDVKKGRYELRIGDAKEFAKRSATGDLAGTFDLIIIDTTDVLLGEEAKEVLGVELFTAELYENLRGMLRPNGVLAQNAQSLDSEHDVRRLMEVIGTSFDTVVPFGFATPDYTSPYFCLLAHGEGSHCPQSASCAEQLLRPGVLAGTPPRFYSAEMHAASFVLPASIADIAASRDDCDDDEAA